MDASVATIPPHIPPALVYDFDHYNAAEIQSDPQRRVSGLLHKFAPDIFYSPRNGGCWIVTRAEIASDMLRRSDLFSSDPRYNKAKVFTPPFLPVQVDPPDHAEFRRVLNPAFSPKSISHLETDIRALARELIDAVVPNGRCEFVAEIGEVFPVTIFLQLAGAPVSDRHQLGRIAVRYTRSSDYSDRQAAVTELAAYLRDKLDERKRNPGNDVLSRIVTAQFFGRALTSLEEEGLAVQVFLAGLDTVKATLSFIMLYLAQHPEQYTQLVQGGISEGVIEELMRINSTTIPERGVSRDVEYRGIRFRQGERILMLTQIWGLDDRYVADPYTVDFSRQGVRHFLFGGGAHRCLGLHLARLEIRVFLEEWVRTFARFEIENNVEVRTASGATWSPIAVPLAWPTPPKP